MSSKLLILSLIVVLISGMVISCTKKPESPTQDVVTEEKYGISGTISIVDIEDNFLMITTDQNKEIKINLNDNIEFMELETESFEEGSNKYTITTQKDTKITATDLKEGYFVSIHSTENIAGKTEINNVDFVQVWRTNPYS